MTLNADERRLLELIAQASEPVAASDFFHEIHPPTFDPGAPDDDPAREAWNEQQIGLFRASVTLWQGGLVRVVHPANGERPDLASVTDAGRAALTHLLRSGKSGLTTMSRSIRAPARSCLIFIAALMQMRTVWMTVFGSMEIRSPVVLFVAMALPLGEPRCLVGPDCGRGPSYGSRAGPAQGTFLLGCPWAVEKA